jgi:2-aminobenzoate-CoA ligase
MTPSGHVDSFARDNLPPPELWPELLPMPGGPYPLRLNCVTELLDVWLGTDRADALLFITPTEEWSYRDFAALVNRICNRLVGDMGMLPGHRVLLHAPNTPIMVACYFAVMKAGGIVVSTMPLLRAKELAFVIDKAQISLALTDARLLPEVEKARQSTPVLQRIVSFGDGAADGLEASLAHCSPEFTACDTAADDVCLIGFTSGTTGEPKGTMHFHRDMLIVCDTYARHILRAEASDLFIGSAPLAFTFGLGGLVLFPMRVGAGAVLLERAGPDDLLAAFAQYHPTICFTAPTAYRAMLPKLAGADISSLRKCVSAGEGLQKSTWEAWYAATGMKLMDGIGGTEMLHIYIAAREEDIRPGATGKAVPGFIARVVDEDGVELPPGTVGRLAVRGPLGCRYLADPRQTTYVRHGWNMPGDSFLMDEDGYFWYQARSDDMIVSSGYNIAGPEVEAALMAHPAVAECGVVGAPDPDRGLVVKAYVVLHPGQTGDAAMVKALQDHVKAEIAPYKYPRAVAFVTTLPRTESGKLQRFALRQLAAINS